jgi:hypothetical protein
MNVLKWGVATLVAVMYGLSTVIFFLDWGRLSATTHLSTVQLVMHCLFSGGAVTAGLAVYCAARRALPEVVIAAVVWPVEFALGYVLLAAGFGYWLLMKGVLTAGAFLIVRVRN